MASAACTCGETAPPPSTAPTLAFESPSEGAAFDLTDDLLPDRPGVQLEAVLAATALEGATVTVTAPGSEAAPPTAIVRGGSARIVYTLAESGLVSATATDGTNAATATPVRVTLDPAPVVCRIAQPSDGAVLGAADDIDPAPGFQARVRVRCAGVPLGSPVTLSVAGAALAPVPLGPGGVAEFPAVELLEGENELEAAASTGGDEAVRARAKVTVRTGACRVTLAPASGTVFNARGEGPHASVVADLVAGAPMNAALLVETAADCAGGTLSIEAGDAVLATAAVTSTRLEVPVELPEGEAVVRARVSGAVAGVSPAVRYVVDSVLPTATLTAPAAGAVLADPDDVAPEQPGLQVRVEGSFTGIGGGRPYELVLDPGSPEVRITAGILADDETFSVVYDLPFGEHTLVVRASRDLGTTAASAPVAVRSAYVGGSVAFVAPRDGASIDLSGDLDVAAPGMQVGFALATTGLAGASGVLRCGTQSVAFSVGPDGAAQVQGSFPSVGCAGAAVECVATVTASTGAQFSSGPLRLFVDGTPPEVQLLSPGADVTSSSTTVDVAATTGCPGEAQSAQVLRAGVELAAAPVAVNAVSFPAVGLASGENLLVLRVTDAAGNFTDAPFRVFVDADAPVPEFVEPVEGRVFTAADDAQGGLADGLQAAVKVALDNELVGTLVELKVGARAPVSARTVLDAATGRRFATFAGVTLPEGPSVLRACGIDETGTSGCAYRQVSVATGRPRCNVVAPDDGALLGRRADLDPQLAGVQANVLVETDAPAGSNVQLAATAPDGTVTTLASPVVAGGATAASTATFAAFTFAPEGTWRLAATCTAADGTVGPSLDSFVTSRLSAPAVEIVDPVEAQVFNLADPDRGVAAGFQADVQVRAVDPAPGATVTLTVQCGQGPRVLGPVPVDGAQVALFRAVSLPDEAECTLSAVLEDAAGNQSPTAQRNVRVDRVAPTVTIVDPADGLLIGANGDRDATLDDLQRSVLARATGLGASNRIELSVGGVAITDAPSLQDRALGREATWPVVTIPDNFTAPGVTPLLPPVTTVLRVTVTDEAGNAASAEASVTVDVNAPVVSIAGLVNNQVLNRSGDRAPATPGMQRDIFLAGEKLGAGTTVQVFGNDVLLGEAAMGGGAAVVPGLTLPEGAVTLRARASDSLGNTADSATVRVVVDSVPPVVSELVLIGTAGGGETPLDTTGGATVFGRAADGSSTQPGFQARVRARVTGLDGATSIRARLVDTNPSPGTVVAERLVAADGTVEFDVSLAEGGHRLHLAVSDAASNPASTPEVPQDGVPAATLSFGVDTVAPTLSILAPTAGTLLARSDADPALPGLQLDLDVASDAGAGRAVAVTLDGQPLASLVLPTSGPRVQSRVTLPEGAHTLAASVADIAGNATDAAPVAVFVDSIAPTVAITQPAAGATLSTDADPEAEGFQVAIAVQYGQVETGRDLVVASSTGGTLATVATDATGSATFASLTVPAGAQQFTARVSDASGNETVAQVAVTIDTGAPAIRFVDTSGLLFFGRGDGFSGNTCTPAVAATCDTEGATAVLVVNGVEQAPATVVNGRVALTGLSIAQGATASIKLKATDAQGRTGFSATRQATCDLAQPALTMTAPTAASVRYVAFGNPGQVAGALSDRIPGSPLEADLAAQVTGASGGTVTVTSSLDGVVATQPVTSDPFTASFTSVAFPSKGSHTVTVEVSTRARNRASASFTAVVDVVAPGAANAAAAARAGSRTGVVLTFPAPGDDGSAGGSVASYLVRRAESAIDDETKWAAATALTPTVTVAAAGAEQAIALEGQPFEKQWFYAVRALDAAGNLGPLGASPSADLRNARTYLTAPVGASSGTSRVLFADLDGDGRDDLVASAGTAGANAGAVSVTYGANVPGAAVTLTARPPSSGQTETGTTLSSVASNGIARFGASLAAGDVNGDGLGDLLVGAHFETAPGNTATARDGAVYVYLGRSGVRLTATSAADIVIYGNTNSTSISNGMAAELAVADVTGDGIDDVVATNPVENTNKGLVRIFAGRTTWPTFVTAAGAAATITSERSLTGGPRLGWRVVALGDLNGDGRDELALAAPAGTLPAAGPGLRPVYVLSGALLTGSGLLVERVSVAVHAVDAAASVPTTSAFGYDLAAGDVTGDAKSDLLALDTTGRMVVVSGAALAPLLPAVPNAAGVLPDASSARVGVFNSYFSTAGGFPGLRYLGDVTGDGIGDFGTTLAGSTSSNELSVFYGRSDSAWGAAGLVRDALIGRVDTTKEFGNFACRAVAGRFLGASGAPDIALLDLGGAVTVLSFR